MGVPNFVAFKNIGFFSTEDLSIKIIDTRVPVFAKIFFGMLITPMSILLSIKNLRICCPILFALRKPDGTTIAALPFFDSELIMC